MTKLKKVLLASAATVMTAALAIGGTMAYLTSNDSDVNVMTLGNVKIEQLEYQRAEGVAHNAGDAGKGNGVKEGALVPFVNNQALYPAVPSDDTAYTAEATDLFYWGDYVYSGTAGNGLWNDDKLSNVMDKMVFVKNTGKSDAYTRTLIAFECPEGMEYSEGSDKEFMMNTNGSKTAYTWEKLGYIAVDGTRYLVMEATYLNALHPGNTAHPSLLQVVMTHNATNEDMELLGDTYEILVLSQAVQTEGFNSAAAALETAFPKGEDNKNVAEWFGGVWKSSYVDEWDGTFNTAWYFKNPQAETFTLGSAEDFAGLASLVDGSAVVPAGVDYDGLPVSFEGKTVKLDANVNLYREDENGEAICFDPIGSYRKDQAFKGTFDGQGYTISGLTQNTWALDNGYYYGDLGLGLFGKVQDATIKNLTIDQASISGESALCGAVAATAYGKCKFDNITVTNSNIADYQYYAGGIVGWASGEQVFTNINVEESTTVATQWGDFNNRCGGIIGGTSTSGTYTFKDCEIACRIDAPNDYVSAYQWGNYRNCGMLIGSTGFTATDDAVTTVAAPNVTCENVTVIFGDWANYHYCEFGAMSYPYVRVEAGVSVDAYSNVRYGHPTDANGNTVVDDNHVHNDGEDHHRLMEFTYLFGGPSDHRYCHYGLSEFDGVTVIKK